MKDRILEIMSLAYEVNESVRWTYVSIDYNKGMGTLVTIHDLLKDITKVYTSKVHSRDLNLNAEEPYIQDEGFAQAEAALKEILKGAKAA